MLKRLSSITASSRLAAGIAGLALIAGCEASVSEPPPAEKRSAPASSRAKSEPASTETRAPGNVIRPDDIVIVENGQVTVGQPKETEEVEKKIYKTLSYHRNVANEIEANVPGGNAGSRQSRQDYDFAVRNYRSLYQLSDADIAAILKKGDEQGWK